MQRGGNEMGHHPNSLRALREHGPKKGDPPRNRVVDPKSGEVYYANGWSKLREKFRDRLERDADDLQDVLIAEAMTGNVQALRLALGPILNMRAIELSGTDGVPINFAELARKAQENE
jgi:hypothetical protein